MALRTKKLLIGIGIEELDPAIFFSLFHCELRLDVIDVMICSLQSVNVLYPLKGKIKSLESWLNSIHSCTLNTYSALVVVIPSTALYKLSDLRYVPIMICFSSV